MENDEEISQMVVPENYFVNDEKVIKEMPKSRMIILLEKNIEEHYGLNTQCFLIWMDNPYFAKAMFDYYGSFTKIAELFSYGGYDEATEMYIRHLEPVLKKMKE